MSTITFNIRVFLKEDDTRKKIIVTKSKTRLIKLIKEWYIKAHQISEESLISTFSIKYIKDNIFQIDLQKNNQYNFNDQNIMEYVADPDEDGNYPFILDGKQMLIYGIVIKEQIN